MERDIEGGAQFHGVIVDPPNGVGFGCYKSRDSTAANGLGPRRDAASRLPTPVFSDTLVRRMF